MGKRKKYFGFLIYFIIIAVIVAGDQLSKRWIVTHMTPDSSIKIWGNLLNFTYTTNTGAAFSHFQNQQWLLIVVTSLLILASLYIIITRKFEHFIGNAALAMIIGGGLGNLVDRVFKHEVVDFIEFNIPFAIFNVADCFVVIGAFLAFFYIIYIEHKAKREQKPSVQK